MIRPLLPLALVLLPALACSTSSLRRGDLPEDQVAFVYLTEDEATQRAELIDRERSGERPERAGTGRARLDAVANYLGVGRSDNQKRIDSLGRLSLLTPRTESVEPQGFALRGAIPLDWAPDRERLLYVSRRHGDLQIFEYVRRTGGLRALTRGPSVHPSACYGPDGQIAYSEVRVGPAGARSRIFVTSSGGASPRMVTPGPLDSDPAWSPDGEVLLYVLDAASDSARIMATDPTGEQSPRLVARGRSPVFTPDGGWVVYSARTSSGWRLRRMRPDGSGKLRMGRGSADEHLPTVSPDGRFVAYVAEDGLRRQLRVRTLDGSSDRPLLERGDGRRPVWN